MHIKTAQKEADRSGLGKKFNRYPGIHSFGTDPVQQRLFFGRDQEIRDLVQRLRTNRLMVLYGLSGLGKTSLLQAGVFPRLNEFDMVPMRVRFQDYSLSPMAALVQGIQNEIVDMSDVQMYHKPTKTWWEFFKTTAFWRGDRVLTPVLILDQFEEIFTLQDHRGRAAIAKHLSHLVNGSVPPDIMTDLRSGKLSYNEDPPEIRVVLSLRIEYVGQLQELFSQIPSILSRRFIVMPLGRGQARDAIVKPAEQVDEKFATPPFNYPPQQLESLLDYLTDEDSGTVEPYHLQLQCQEIERKVGERQAKTEGLIEIDDLILGKREDLEQVVRGFYLRTVGKLSQAVKKRLLADDHSRLLARLRAKQAYKAARKLCEFELLSDRGYRMPLHQAQILEKHSLKEDDLEFLVTSRLLRRERKLKSFTYELSHDSLAKPIFYCRPYRMSPKARKTAGIIAVIALIIFAGLVWRTAQKEIEVTQIKLKDKRISDAAAAAAVQRLSERDDVNSRLIKVIRETVDGIEESIIENRKISQTLDAALQLSGNQHQLRAKIETAQKQMQHSQKLLTKVNPKNTLNNTKSISSDQSVPVMVSVNAGCFQMGGFDDDPDAVKNEFPQHEVCFEKGFLIGKYEVTFGEYDVFAVETGRKLSDDKGWGRDKRPVINVSWEDARAYAEWLSKVTGKSFRLPTEAEWEYAARSSGMTEKYAGGDDLGKLGWYSDNSEGMTHPVGKKGSNGLGTYDMSGNVWEWVEDDWHDNYKNAPPDGRALVNDPRSADRVVRGGSWSGDARRCRSTFRSYGSFDFTGNIIGFRLAGSVTLGP